MSNHSISSKAGNDTRIWKDFEKMELNQEWIEENLQEQRVRLQAIYMIPDPTIQNQSKTP